MNIIKLINIFLLSLTIFFSCKEDEDRSNEFVGLWQVEQALENDEQVSLSTLEMETRILIEANGLYRLHSAVEGIVRSGTWLFTPTERIDFSMDRKDGIDRHDFTEYQPCPVPFVVDELSQESFTIKYRCTASERKRFVMFFPKNDELAYTELVAKELAETDVDKKTAIQKQILDLDHKMVTYTFKLKAIIE